MPINARRQLKKIATAMDRLEKTGSKLSMDEKRTRLLAVFGYGYKNSLNQLGKTERDLEFLEKVYRQAQKDFDGRMNPLYENGKGFYVYDEDTQKEKLLSGDNLKQYVEKTRKRLDIATFAGRGSSGKVKFQDILDTYDPDLDETSPPLIERYINELIACKGQIRAVEALQRKQRKKDSSAE